MSFIKSSVSFCGPKLSRLRFKSNEKLPFGSQKHARQEPGQIEIRLRSPACIFVRLYLIPQTHL